VYATWLYGVENKFLPWKEERLLWIKGSKETNARYLSVLATGETLENTVLNIQEGVPAGVPAYVLCKQGRPACSALVQVSQVGTCM
jgi:hypothetical protein